MARFQDLALRLLGATSGEQIIKAAAAASGAITLPAGTTDFSATGPGLVQQTTGGAPFTVGPVAASNVVGTATNDNAAAGNIGEYISSNITTPVSITTGTALNLTTISLTAGDWDVTGAVCFTPAGGTVVTRTFVAISTTSLDLTQSNLATCSFSNHQITYAAGTLNPTEIPAPLRLSLSTTTTVYLVLYCSFTTSTCTAIGILRARRMR
jgi:hypothetical protein